MNVWWGVFAYMIVISASGMIIHKGRKSGNSLAVDVNDSKKYQSIGLFMAFLSFALLVFFVGQRSWIFDTTDYQFTYTNGFTGDFSEIKYILEGKSDTKSPLYNIILIAFKGITHGSYNAWFTFIAIIQCVGLAILFQKYSVNYTFSIFLFFSSSCFLWLVNGMRQFLVATIVFMFFDLIAKKKTVPFLILIFILYFIHSSVLFWIPVYFIIRFKPWSKKFILSTLSLAILLFLVSNTSLLQETDYSYVGEETTGVNPLRVIVMSVPVILSFVFRKQIAEEDDPVYNLIINLSFICSACFIVGMFTNGFVARLAVYFQVFNYLSLPWLMKKIDTESSWIKYLSIVCFMAYFLYDMYVVGNGIYKSDNLRIF
ncbi:MAG: EpsG family protein [Eubacteriales bacterium]|nr:EpsG family protein [Eubacteriales bacterium]